MFKFVRSCSFFAAIVCLFSASGAFAQSQTQTPLSRQMERVDLGLSAPFTLTHKTSGGNVISQNASEASGVLATLRYTKSPWIGVEMNYMQSRMTENYNYYFHAQIPGGGTTSVPTLLGVQSNVRELTWGYVAHAPNTYFGFKPFGGAGLGTLEFKPTPNGGQGLERQFRAVYYWNLGADYQIMDSHFGMRAQVRQLFYIAPDFEQSYLLSGGARTNTFVPSIGFYARF